MPGYIDRSDSNFHTLIGIARKLLVDMPIGVEFPDVHSSNIPMAQVTVLSRLVPTG